MVKISRYHTDPTNGVEEIYHTLHLQERGGVGYFTVPVAASLAEGERYDWQVSFACDIEVSSYQGSANYQASANSQLRVVSPTEPMVADLTNALAIANSPVERADAYAMGRISLTFRCPH